MHFRELYDKVIEAYKSGDEGLFNASARNWIEETDTAPFNEEELDSLYWAAKHHCALWRSNAINSRVSKRRMIECVRKIAEKGVPNPYPKKEEVKEVKEVKEEAPEKEAVHVLGVVPEETKDEKHFFAKRNKKS